MTVFDKVETQILHALRLKGFADIDTLATHLALWECSCNKDCDTTSRSEIENALTESAQRGHVRLQEHPFRAWSLTDSGRQFGQELLSTELDSHPNRQTRQLVTQIYHDFLPTNRKFLELCTSWQTRTVGGQIIINDHTDPSYDALIISRLHVSHDEITNTCDALSELLNRFKNYRTRFSHALCHIVEGDYDWFTKLTIDSYHTIWFELHEDLLATLGRHRTQEQER